MQNAENSTRITIGKCGVAHVDTGDRCRESENVPGLDSIHDLRNSHSWNHVARMSIETALHLTDRAENIFIRERRMGSG